MTPREIREERKRREKESGVKRRPQSKEKRKSSRKKAEPKKLTAGKIILRILAVIGVTLLMILLFLYLVMAVVMKGPSSEAQRLFVLSTNETSAVKFLPKLYISEEKMESILHPQVEETLFSALPVGSIKDSDASNSDDTIQNTSNSDTRDSYLTEDEYANATKVDSDVLVIDVMGSTYKGKLMIVYDASRVYFASINNFGGAGMTVNRFMERDGAVGATNAGGFEDENGGGSGGIPDGIVIRNGQIVYGSAGETYSGFAGFDANHKLFVGNVSGQTALNNGVVNGTNFKNGIVLIKDGVRATGLNSGINPRTVIGQRADGTVLMLAVEGRMADSLGATCDDLSEVMEKYGAVNAVNLDGGSSSGMYLNGERITRSCSVKGERPVPTAVLVSGVSNE